MKTKFLALIAILFLVTSLMATTAQAPVKNSNYDPMPANPEKILQLLIKQGVVSANAPKDQQEAAVYNYLQLKTKGGSVDQPNPLAKKQLDANEESQNLNSGSSIRGKKLGNTTNVPASSPQFKPTERYR